MERRPAEKIRRTLEEAAASGLILRIVYQAGSQPGTTRDIKPVSLIEDRIIAVDVASGTEKTYLLGNIALATDEPAARAYDPALVATDDDRSISSAIVGYLDELKICGWHVECGEDSIGVYRRFKNGKPRKTADVLLAYWPQRIEQEYDYQTNSFVEHTRTSARPYRVESREMDAAKTFGHLSKALALFLAEARRLAPSDAT